MAAPGSLCTFKLFRTAHPPETLRLLVLRTAHEPPDSGKMREVTQTALIAPGDNRVWGQRLLEQVPAPEERPAGAPLLEEQGWKVYLIE